ncbi:MULTISPECIES: hypothetical protein [Bacillales]|jgi:uncharacterized small protein (DUF1192 family)|uniref:Uncharacterized protein n=1 Tax=Brevibacillus aydinogluensis TaxID=927786 RepID=A0AA48M9Z4_9BACL|nr:MULTISPECIES: hypothetical protein [Bacillales]MBR8660875.1 hypothetical protein [Brevibacillus sp. NL20B1]MDT3416902.1 uncharacterized small protein (DUF1192 family) [Brevibacillus aydinogluensis]UFJ61388.1 hypothetical protein IRT44_00540 [Anoxybacillus sediminis]CAJ1001758.1 hypothetical protein BSPP4475_05365 [Brevibacillus aydinogluensis]
MTTRTMEMEEKIRKMEAELRRLRAELAKLGSKQSDETVTVYLNEVYNG